MLFDVEHASFWHFSGEHVGQGSPPLRHGNVEEAGEQTEVSNISNKTIDSAY